MKYDKFQPLGRPDFVVTNCEKILQNPPKPDTALLNPDASCPVKVKIPLAPALLKWIAKAGSWKAAKAPC